MRRLSLLLIATVFIAILIGPCVAVGNTVYILSPVSPGRTSSRPEPEPEPEPPSTDQGVYVLDNEHWGVCPDDQTKADSNARKISDALQWAASNNLYDVKLQRGTYYINGVLSEAGGIGVPSNINLDLNQSTLIQPSNGAQWYGIFHLDGSKNVTICNGKLIGDRNTHDYVTIPYSHEFGMGVICWAVENVCLSNLDISQMTGDAILVYGNGYDTPSADGGTISRNILITGCTLSYCRRQGITVSGAQSVEISYNDINHISGTAPQCGIDLEGEHDWLVSNIYIHDNSFSSIETAAVLFHRNAEKCNLSNNYIEGKLSVYYGKDITITGNTIVDGAIYLTNTPEVYNTMIEYNNFVNSFVSSSINTNTVVQNNTMDNGFIIFNNCSGAILNNYFLNSSSARPFAILIKADKQNGEESYEVQLLNNTVIGNYRTSVQTSQEDNLIITN
jgi:hypothetical protein